MSGSCGGEPPRPARDFGFTDADGETRFREIFGDLKMEGDESVGVLDAESSLQISDVGNTDVADGIPVLAESLRLAGREEGEVRLIVGVDAGHELDVGSVVVSEAPVPGVAEFVVAPRPLFLAGSDVVVCVGDGASARR